MSTTAGRRLKSVLALALQTPPDLRRARIAEACGTDDDLRQRVETLVSLYDRREEDEASPVDSTTTRVEMPPPPEPRAWCGFSLLQRVGRGGFGTVYRGWDPVLEREVAVKIIRRRGSADVHAEDWMREGQVLAQLDHRNIVRVYSAGRSGDELGLVMEYVHGQTLTALVEHIGAISEAE